ncbi:RNA pol II accessory factor, Cdc73 family-domain-containing protein [Limtongia smithiae]|uniref:RNA pol II accessory factor, Cdc73 family-domain-containing protein n=1 Tax=Limtongia smithiae TaxID=1125753 RepID=UPI0034CD3B9A
MADPLLLLRHAVAANAPPRMLPTADPAGAPVTDIAQAAFLTFPADPTVAPLSFATPTRFVRANGAVVDLRAAFFCWLSRDENVASYLKLCGEKDVATLAFIERTSLVTWIQGADDDSEFIKPLDVMSTKAAPSAGDKKATVPSASAQLKTAAPPTTAGSSAPARVARPVDPLLASIYAQERTLLDHNSVLRGGKATDFAYVRKEAFAAFLQHTPRERSGNDKSAAAQALHGRGSSSQGSALSAAGTAIGTVGAGSAASGSSRRRDPIILLSPSASALITMANVKDFLERGSYTPPQASASGVNIQMISRQSPRLGSMRFVVVDSVERFKPDYWDRVVAVFTTGQSWQFRAYPTGLSDPHALFQKVKGFCVVYAGDPVPDAIRTWNVDVVQVDKLHRFRDRETVEGLWDVLDKWMGARGWASRRH